MGKPFSLLFLTKPVSNCWYAMLMAINALADRIKRWIIDCVPSFQQTAHHPQWRNLFRLFLVLVIYESEEGRQFFHEFHLTVKMGICLCWHYWQTARKELQKSNILESQFPEQLKIYMNIFSFTPTMDSLLLLMFDSTVAYRNAMTFERYFWFL